VNANRRGTTLSASWETVMSSAGEIDRFHEDGFPGLLSPPPSRDTTRGVEAEGAARGDLEADDSTRVGGRTT
jgi:hypothetical protein